jgi:DNA-binding PadR family transcriptional regulator
MKSKTTRAPETEPLNATAASLLGFLQDAPMTGGDLMTHVESIIGDFWNVTRSQVYRELKLLADRGYVSLEATGPRDRQPYSVTAEGRAAFRAWLEKRPGPPMMRFPLVLTVFFASYLDRDRLQEYLDEQRAYHEERLRAYREFELVALPGTGGGEALRMGISFQKTILKWIDSIPPGKLGGHTKAAEPPKKPLRKKK